MGREAGDQRGPTTRPKTHTHISKGDRRPHAAPRYAMKTRIALVTMLLVAATAAAPPARADEVVRGRTLSVALRGLPDQIAVGEPLNVTVEVEVADDGTSLRKPVQIVVWIETPFGPAILEQQTRRILPGRTLRFAAAFNYSGRVPPASGGTMTVGVTATLKSETLEATHTLTIVGVETAG